MPELNQIQEAKAKWEAGMVAKTLAKFPEQKKEFQTVSGRPVERLYTPESFDEATYLKQLGFPGQFPFTRGVQPTMYRGRFWTMRQYAGFASAEESNQRYKYLLQQGTTGLSVAFDLPTQIGYDSDDTMAAGEIGKVGVAIDTLADMEILFNGIPLDKVSTSMTINASAAVLLAMYIAVGEKQGVPADKLEGTIQNDVLKEYIARGTYIFPPKPSLRIISDIFAYCTKSVPNWNTISISGYHIREAGSTAGQEVGFTLADAICYVDTALKAGLKVDEFAGRLAFFFAAHTDVLEEVAKFRAARRLYARIMKERFGASDRSAMLRFHTQTGGVTLTAQQPDNNIVRVTLQALSAVLGGTQSLHTNSKDEALALPTEESVTVALRTQQIIAHESGVTNSIDPLAGSYYVEKLTDQIEEEAYAYIKKIDALGGMVTAIEQGWVQKQIEESAYRFGQSVETGDRVIVGVNKFQAKDEKLNLKLLRIDESVGQRQVAKLKKVKAERDQAKVQQCLANVAAAARGSDNLMPPILEAVRAYASIGEICNALRGVFGEYQESFN